MNCLIGSLRKVADKAVTETFPEGCAKTALDLAVKEISFVRLENPEDLEELWYQEGLRGMHDPRQFCDRKREIVEAMEGNDKKEKDIINSLLKVMSKIPETQTWARILR